VTRLRVPALHREPREGEDSLRGRVALGGAHIALREAAGLAVRLGGVLIVVRIIGPGSYGIYVAASAFVLLVTMVTQMGSEVWLIRQQREPTIEQYQEVIGFLLLSVSAGVAIGLAGSYGATRILHERESIEVFRLLLISVPVNVLWAPAQARIERSFGFRRMAILELSSDVALYGVAIPLALAGLGPWSLALGWIACQLLLLVGSYYLAGLRPRPRLSVSTSRALLRHGRTYATSGSLQQVANLANPIIVGSLIGSAGVGVVALAIRLVETAGFAIRVAIRLGVTTFSRISDRDRLTAGLAEGTAIYVIALGLPLCLAAVISRAVIPVVLGRPWASVVPLFALLALARVLSAGGALQSTVLWSRGRNLAVGVVAGANVALLFLAAWLFVPHLGLAGYGVATLCTLPTLILTDRFARQIAPIRYTEALPPLLMLAPITLFGLVPLGFTGLLFLPLVAVLSLAGTRKGIARIIGDLLADLRVARSSDSGP
jgi:O-antigen/teichoic acid export membrane protein